MHEDALVVQTWLNGSSVLLEPLTPNLDCFPCETGSEEMDRIANVTSGNHAKDLDLMVLKLNSSHVEI